MFSRIIDYLDDRLNPIVVKEIRQYLNSRAILSCIVFVLLMELVSLFIFIFFNDNNTVGRGMDFFTAILVILSLGCFFGIGFSACNRVTLERKAEALDLIYSTVLSPHKIISGKLLSGMVMVSLLFSLCLPFMCVSYYLRGIDMPKIILLTYCLYILNIPVLLLMLLVGISAINKLIRIAAGIILSVLGFGFLQAALSSFSRGSSLEFLSWWPLFWYTIIVFSAATGFFLAAAAMISPQSSNQTMPLRLYFAICWTVFLIAALIASYVVKNKLPLTVWANVFYIIAVFNLMIAAAERDDQSRRVLSRLPAGKIRRRLFFMFSSGSAAGLLFSIAMISLTALAVLIAQLKPSSSGDSIYIILGISAYFISYAEITLVLKRALQRRFSKIKGLGVFCSVVAAAMLTPIIISAMLFQSKAFDRDTGALFFIFSPTIFSYKSYYTVGYAVSAGMALLMFIMVIPELRRQLRQYFPKAEVTSDAV
jgi:hypothetical protein